MSYWVEVALPAEGQTAVRIQLDLALVTKVDKILNEGKLEGILVRYDKNQDLALDLGGAESFLEFWDEYQPMKKIAPEVELGLVHVQSNFMRKMMYQQRH